MSTLLKGFCCTLLCILSISNYAQTILHTPNVESVLYTGKGKNQPLVVGLGGSEGGNAWTSDYWKPTRDQFIEKGYAFLAIGYFKAKGTPDTLNKISIEDVYNAIKTAASQKGINKKQIAVIGGSRGGDLALLLGSYYQDIRCVVAMMASHVAFPGHTNHFTSSCWTYKNQELPFVPLSKAAVPFLLKRDLRRTFEEMLKDTVAAERASIAVEKINGPLLLMSATQDEICPSTPMADKMMARLTSKNFRHYHDHISFEGRHSEPLEHFDQVFDFLEKHFKK